MLVINQLLTIVKLIMQRKTSLIRLFLFLLLIAGLTVFAKSQRTQAANLESVSVTMSNSRFSFRGQVSGTPGSDTSTPIIIDPAIADYTSNANTEITDALIMNDVITFTGATAGDRTITEIVDDNIISIDSAVATTDESFYLDETTDLTAVFNTNTTATAGYVQVLVPAASTNNADGIPDQGYFDFGSGAAPTVTCAGSGGASHTFGVGHGTATANQTGGDLPAGYWHVYQCEYTTGGTNGTITMTIGSGADDAIINPVPTAAHVTGVADTYSVIVRNVNSATTPDTVVDSTTVKIGAIEAVRVSATVVPSLTFTITGQADSLTRCGTTTDVTTTASSVPFGEIATANFTDAAQELKFTTNALDGAVVTAIANDQLGRGGSACDVANAGTDKKTTLLANYTIDPSANEHLCIWDANIIDMTQNSEQAWTTITTTSGTGFGYSIENIDSASPTFTYGTGTDFDARHFADAQSGDTPVTIFGSNLLPTNSDSVYVCYRIAADALTAAGDYYNYITYTATATF